MHRNDKIFFLNDNMFLNNFYNMAEIIRMITEETQRR